MSSCCDKLLLFRYACVFAPEFVSNETSAFSNSLHLFMYFTWFWETRRVTEIVSVSRACVCSLTGLPFIHVCFACSPLPHARLGLESAGRVTLPKHVTTAQTLSEEGGFSKANTHTAEINLESLSFLREAPAFCLQFSLIRSDCAGQSPTKKERSRVRLAMCVTRVGVHYRWDEGGMFPNLIVV